MYGANALDVILSPRSHRVQFHLSTYSCRFATSRANLDVSFSKHVRTTLKTASLEPPMFRVPTRSVA